MKRTLRELANTMCHRFPRDYYYLVIGDFVTKIGDYIYQIAFPLLLLDVTQSVLWSGFSFAAAQVGTIVAGIVSGPIVDRFHPKRVLMCSALTMALLTVSVVVSSSQHFVFVIWGLASCMLLEICNFMYRSCLNSLIPQIVDRENIPDSTAVTSFVRFLSKTVGPMLGGVLVAMIGSPLTIMVDTASCLLLVVITACIRVKNYGVARSHNMHMMHDVLDGFRYIIHSRALLGLNLLNFAANLGYAPLLAMFVVHLTDTVGLSSQTVGFIYAMDGIASLIGGLAIPWAMRHFVVGKVIVASCVILGLSISGLGIARHTVAIGILFFMALCAAQTANKSMYTYWQMAVPEEYLARVFGLSSTLENLATPIASSCAGVVSQLYSTSVLFVCCGVIVLVSGIGTSVSTGLRNLDIER